MPADPYFAMGIGDELALGSLSSTADAGWSRWHDWRRRCEQPSGMVETYAAHSFLDRCRRSCVLALSLITQHPNQDGRATDTLGPADGRC
jgi:hypothetical protein